jgi:hypothetical protein
MNSVKIVEEFRDRVWKARNPCLVKPKLGPNDDAALRELGCSRSDQIFARAENRAHPFAMRDVCGPGCNRKRNFSERDATAPRRTRSDDSRLSRRIDPMSLSTRPFCHGEGGAVGWSLIRIADPHCTCPNSAAIIGRARPIASGRSQTVGADPAAGGEEHVVDDGGRGSLIPLPPGYGIVAQQRRRWNAGA